MTLNQANGTNSILFRDSDTHAGLQAITCTYTEDSNMKFQTSRSVRFARSILKSFSQDTKTCFKRSSLLRKTEKMETRTRKKELKRTNKVFTTWKDSSNCQIRPTSRLPATSKTRSTKTLLKTSRLLLDKSQSISLQRSQRS